MNSYQAYETLKVSSDASFDDIKYAYRKLALELHPDKNNEEKDGIKFKQVTEAYHFLKNNHKRENAKHKTTSAWNFTNTNSKEKQTFRKRPQWGAPPEEDWSRFTKEFEEENPDFWKEYEKEFWKNYDMRMNSAGSAQKQEKRHKKEPKLNLFVDVDPTRCIACCSCETIAPEVFVIDKLTKLNPKSRVYNEKGAGYNKIMNAAETCPTKAIIVEDRDSKQRLYPW